MRQIYYASLLLLLVVALMSLPMKILVPLIPVLALAYLYYDGKRQSLNKKIIEALKQAADLSKNNTTIQNKLLEIAELRSGERFIETVLVEKDGERLLSEAIKQDLPLNCNNEKLVEYLLKHAEQLAYGETYEDLESYIIQVKETLATKPDQH